MSWSRYISLVFALFGGFRQAESASHGCAKIHRELRLRYSCPDIYVTMRPWDCDPVQDAAIIERDAVHDAPVIGLAYSWGAPAAVKFCRAMSERGRYVQRLYL